MSLEQAVQELLERVAKLEEAYAALLEKVEAASVKPVVVESGRVGA